MTFPYRSVLTAVLPLAVAIALTGCGGSGSGSSSDGETGSLTLDATDAPVDDATEVNVVFTGITLKPAEGDRIAFTCDDAEFDCASDDDGEDADRRSIDLLALSGDASERLIEDAEVPAGHYEWIRLHVDAASPDSGDSGASTIVLEDGTEHDLTIPSGSRSGLKLVSGFDVPVGGAASFTIDFDLRKAVTRASDRYVLRPAHRLVDNAEVGHLAGTIANTFIQDECETGDASEGLAVYVFEGADAPTGDIGSENEPVTTAGATLNDETGDHDYRVGFLAADTYTAAVTCEADNDDPEADDGLTFVDQASVEIESGSEPTELDFE